ncbi:FecCD family ABC transporter permease [Clostridium gasigenes]|uniref:FecCD family ABC transporter permease n=1 Tax=Clostridium gasigenes TaxID=94869 RepID=UPI001C0D2C38|nr:iron ABC transporter permease [Clostridium gasigenes]MBU3106927.1 iron ABC transporter permease [Clostridium gasigenes]
MITNKKVEIRLVTLFILFLLSLFVSVLLGRFFIKPGLLIKVLISKILPITVDWPTQIENLIFGIRLPRVIMGALIGAGLSCAGAAYQGIFKNPMVSPDVLGASSGAGFGAALGLFLALGYKGVSVSAFLFGIIAVLLVYLASKKMKNNPTLALVLTGMMVSSLFTAGISFLKIVADPTNILPAITYWLMGSLASIRMNDVAFAGPLIVVGIIPIFLLRWKINLLTLGDEEARSMGVNTKRVRLIIMVSATLITSAAVSVSGMIGWVGLVIPHLARMIVGSDYRKLVPASLFLGGSYMLIVDNFARLITTSEIPIGILTAFVGAPFFMFLILKDGNKL